jgi:hypothetical protein
MAWAGGDMELLDKIKGGLPIYQAHAETTMDFTGKNLKQVTLNLSKLRQMLLRDSQKHPVIHPKPRRAMKTHGNPIASKMDLNRKVPLG